MVAQLGVFIALFGLACLPSATYANVLGVYGEIYPIKEQDFLIYIKQKLTVMQDSGELKSWQQHMANQAKQRADRPQPVTGLSVTKEEKTHYYDPTITVPYDVTDDEDKVLVSSGTQVNPLSQVNFTSTWLFFDGDDPAQVMWAKNKIKSIAQVKLILVAGSLKEQNKQFAQKIYFDQGGYLTHKLDIHHTPALVEQAGMRLLVREELP